MNQFSISTDILELLYKEFVDFIKVTTNEGFISFKNSHYVDYEENYKYSIYKEAKRNLRSSEWKPDDIGTGKIQKAIQSSMLVKVNHNSRIVDNNLINWRKIRNFAVFPQDKNLEQLFFDFYKNKISPLLAFEGLMKYFDYQLIAYLFFIKDYNQFLPISQKVFDRVIEDNLHISDFKTSGRISWDNYKTFIEIIRQTHRFLRTKDENATLLDAHSFLWILGKQREDWITRPKEINPDGKSPEFLTASTPIVERKAKHFLQYWLPAQVAKDSALGANLRHAGSNKYKGRNVEIGDIVWIVTVKSDGQLYLVGRILVNNIVSHEEALRMFTDDVFDKELHIVTTEENSEPFKEIPLMDIAGDLRFDSDTNDRLTIVNDRIDAKQLQTIRELTTDSINLVESKWGSQIDELQKEIDKKLAEDQEENDIKQQTISEVEKEQLIKARRGQGIFRSNLELMEKGCRLTGIKDKRFLIASHIKAWKDSSNEEKLDGNNGLFLSPHVDKLFDRGWISFSDEGDILTADKDVKEIMKSWGLDCDQKVGHFNEKQREYLAFHRKIFGYQ